jgi:hypothetical protein
MKKRYGNLNQSVWFLGDYPINYTAKKLLYTDYIKDLLQYNDPERKLKKMPKKPTFCSIIFKVCKNIIKSFFIFRMYKYYKTVLKQNYLNERRNTLTITTNTLGAK